MFGAFFIIFGSNFVWCLLHYIRCLLQYIRCLFHYIRCLIHYIRCFLRYIRCFFHYVRCLFHYIRCFFHYILFSKRVSSRSSPVPNQFNIIRFRSETGRNSLRYRGPIIWNFVNRLIKVPESFHSFKQILRKHVTIIDNFSFGKEVTVVANKKDHFIDF